MQCEECKQSKQDNVWQRCDMGREQRERQEEVAVDKERAASTAAKRVSTLR